MLKYTFLLLIRLYQATLSPDHGLMKFFLRRGVCIYRPTCSEYAYQAIKQFGIIKGVRLGTKRLIRCHPWAHGGYDPIKIPNNKSQITNKFQNPNAKLQTVWNLKHWNL